MTNMKGIQSKQSRILAIKPSTKGFGYAVMEGGLVDWGIKTVQGDKNANSVKKVKELIELYQPAVLVLEEISTGSRRSPRIQVLNCELTSLAAKHKVKVRMFTMVQLKRAFFPDGKGTKHALAQIISERFPQELGFRLPPKRKPWKSEDSRMDIFEAVALALVSEGKNK
jgi:Holliday junction resolvasome RuvABC endonuclease subunit